MENKFYIIIGASRGLGASLVSRYLESGQNVIGVGRTNENKIEGMADWKKTGQFRYVQADITEPSSVDILKPILSVCGNAPICVIFNAAVIESDVGDNKQIRFKIFEKVNHTGIDGFGHILKIFSDYLISHGSMLAGISSISAWIPPIRGNKIAYPASKAYLDMALRSLRLLWDKTVHVMIVHLGHMGGNGSWFMPSYDTVAKKVVKATLYRRPPKSICMSGFYCISYSILRFMPDIFLTNISNLMKGLFKRFLPEKTRQ